MSKTAFLLIDYTNDFVADDGKLTCGKPGQALVPVINNLLVHHCQAGNFVFICNDIHDPNDEFHPESKQFPPHNLRSTPGVELFDPVKKQVEALSKDYAKQIIFLEKTRYSAFVGTPLDIMLRARDIKKVALAGVCTDICILHTAIESYNKGYEIRVYDDAVASFNEAGHSFALSHFKQTLGAVTGPAQF